MSNQVEHPQIFNFGLNDNQPKGVIVACCQLLAKVGKNGIVIIGLSFSKPGEPYSKDFGLKAAFLRMISEMGGVGSYIAQWMPIIFKNDVVTQLVQEPRHISWRDRTGKLCKKTVCKMVPVKTASLDRLNVNKYRYACDLDGDVRTTVVKFLRDLSAKYVGNPDILPPWVTPDFIAQNVKLDNKKTVVKKVAKRAAKKKTKKAAKK